MNKNKSWQDKVIKDKNGRITLWQSPNLPLLTWAAATLASKLFAHGRPHQVLEIIAFGAIFTWAWLEVFAGVNYFRRTLGLVVLILSIHSRLT